MYFTKTLLLSASLTVTAVAQTTKLALSNLSTSVTAGSPTEFEWTGGDGTVSTTMLHLNLNEQSINRLRSQAVTILLQQGTANNLQTVQNIAIKSYLALNRVVH